MSGCLGWVAVVWYLAFRNSKYEMAVGYGVGAVTPPYAARMILGPGSEYEMTEPLGWHYVRPIDIPTMSLMVTGIPWQLSAPKSEKKLGPLTQEQRNVILMFFRKHYIGGDRELP